jgi:hypothetical protein
VDSEWGLQPEVRKLDAVILHGSIEPRISLQDTQPNRVICTGLVPGVIAAIDDSTALGLDHLIRRDNSLRSLALNISRKLTGKAKIAIGIARDRKCRCVFISLGLHSSPRIGRPPLVADHIRWDGILHSIMDMGVEAPISLPLGHVGPILEVAG